MLAVAWREMPSPGRPITIAEERELTFAGFCTFRDPAKPSAALAIRRLRGLGVRVKVISGDAVAVVSHLVGSLALEPGAVLSGDEIERLSDQALRVRAAQTDYFARVSPDQKRIAGVGRCT